MKYDSKYILECFSYIDGALIWKERPLSHFKRSRDGKMRNTRFAGKSASTSHPDGYLQVKLNNSLFMVHRIIWIMHYGDIPPGKQIDHINHNRQDNRLENLRLVSAHENSKNRARSAKNLSGITGVYFHKASKKWCAQICQTHLGTYKNKSDAIIARKNAEKEKNFHCNHGK